MRLAGSICRPLVRRWSEILKPEKSVKGLKDSHVGGPTRFLGLKLLSKCIARNKVSSHLLTFMLRRTRSTRTCVFAGLARGGINPPEYIYNTLIVPDGGLGGGVYRGRGSAQDSCRNDARISKCDELSSCRSVNFAADSRPNCTV